jgi:hypothetical protein
MNVRRCDHPSRPTADHADGGDINCPVATEFTLFDVELDELLTNTPSMCCRQLSALPSSWTEELD